MLAWFTTEAKGWNWKPGQYQNEQEILRLLLEVLLWPAGGAHPAICPGLLQHDRDRDVTQYCEKDAEIRSWFSVVIKNLRVLPENSMLVILSSLECQHLEFDILIFPCTQVGILIMLKTHLNQHKAGLRSLANLVFSWSDWFPRLAMLMFS